MNRTLHKPNIKQRPIIGHLCYFNLYKPTSVYTELKGLSQGSSGLRQVLLYIKQTYLL